MKINKKKLQYASLSTVFIILFVVLIMLVNMLFGYLTNRFSLKLDMTAQGEYSLSDETQELLHNLDEDITVYIMQSEATIQKDQTNVRASVVETIRRYSTVSGNKLHYEFIDPNQNPKFYDDYPLAKAAKEGESAAFLIVKSDRRYTPLLLNNIAGYSQDATTRYNNTESELSSAILYVTSKEVSKVAAITGHNEDSVPGFQNILDSNKFETVSVNLRTDSIAEDVNNILIAGPQLDFTDEEIAKIDAFLQTPGHNLYIFWSGQVNTKLPVLERFLADWGFAVSETMVLDQEDCVYSPVIVLGELQENDATANVQQTQQRFLSPNTHPITILWEEKSYTRTMPLLNSGSSSYARLMDASANTTDARKENEARGPFCLAALSEKNVQKSDGSVESNRVFLFGSEFTANEQMTSMPISLNNTIFNTVVSYANTNTNTMQIEPKAISSSDLNFYESQINTLMVILVIVVPLAILALGIVIFLRRRHL